MLELAEFKRIRAVGHKAPSRLHVAVTLADVE
jgi:hypothetical protein